jgi:lipoate synthase
MFDDNKVACFLVCGGSCVRVCVVCRVCVGEERGGDYGAKAVLSVCLSVWCACVRRV